MPFRLDSRHAGFAEEFETLLGSKREVSEEVSAAVAVILEDVRTRGDEAVEAIAALVGAGIDAIADS